MVVRAARKAGRHIGICGQAPSDYPDFAAFLVTTGIDSISLNPDSQPVWTVVSHAEPVSDDQQKNNTTVSAG